MAEEKESLQPGTKDKSRKDGEDLVKVLKDKKYDFVEKRKINSSVKIEKNLGRLLTARSRV
ncbi:hypothetical protein BLIC30S_04592 [Bacillus licheniformis]